MLISMVSGGLLDMFEGDGLLSAPAIAAFVTSLGFVGALASSTVESHHQEVDTGPR